MTETQGKFEGWAVVELYGHSKEVGFVTTQYFGDKPMFQVDVPALPEREKTLTQPQWIGDTFAPIGSKVSAEAVPGRTRLLGPGSVYALNPCTEEVALHQIERMGSRSIKLVSLPLSMALPENVDPEPEEMDYEDEGEGPEEEGNDSL